MLQFFSVSKLRQAFASRINNKDIEIEEELLGEYKIQSVILKTKWDSIYIEPIGRMIIAEMGNESFFEAAIKYAFKNTEKWHFK